MKAQTRRSLALILALLAGCAVQAGCAAEDGAAEDADGDLQDIHDARDADAPDRDAENAGETADLPDLQDGGPETDPCDPLPAGCECPQACVEGACNNDLCPPDPCDPIPDAAYGTLSISGDPSDIPAAEHPDINVKLRGWRPADPSEPRDFIDYGGDTDPGAPRLYSLFTDDVFPGFGDLYVVGCWDGIDVCSEGGYPVHLAGFYTDVGDIIETPRSGYDIGEGRAAMVLYADEDSITLKYTREDDVILGYTIHIVGICVEPTLLALYRSSNDAGRGSLPALSPDQPLGRARDTQIIVAIRDTGAFMDPRSRKDWW